MGQQAPPMPQPDQALTPEQLDDMVAAVALYPDPLLSQMLVASTYPLELVEASQFLQRNPGLTGPALTQAVQQQNWDPSVQALVVFPDVIRLLMQDVTWTTNLGNAFLAQQADVMDAVQRMRRKAQDAGKLASTPQENVVTDNQGGQPIVEILPPDPNVIYVPNTTRRGSGVRPSGTRILSGGGRRAASWRAAHGSVSGPASTSVFSSAAAGAVGPVGVGNPDGQPTR
jgi:hypothetical protein